jgi:TldD protein
MTTIESSEDLLGQALVSLSGQTPYAEVMAETVQGTGLRHDRQSTSLSFAPRMRGAVFRAWDGAGWIEAASSRLDAPGLKTVTDALLRRLAHPKGSAQPPGTAATGRASASTVGRKKLSDWSLDDRIALAKTIFGWATSVPGIENATVGLADGHDERLFLSTLGTRRFQSIDRFSATIVPLAIEGGKVEFDYSSFGGQGGPELFDQIREADVVATARESKALLTAKAAPTGRMTVLMDPSTAGTFAHESFGHGTEADQLLRDRSYLKPLLGEQVGPECLTLVDDGARTGQWGSIFFDDEGFPSQRTVLVDQGRFVEVLHDRESAAEMHRKPTGNCRRADFLSRPFVRMTNTIVEPSTWSFEELLEEAKDGVVLESCTSGIEDPLGGQMQIKVKKGHLIEGGERTQVVPSMALSGRVLDVLRSIRGVSRASDFKLSPGFCGKGHSDLLATGTGGSYLLAEAIVGPA